MSEETVAGETWRPDAEPWGALREASIRGSVSPFGERTGRRLAECLSEMGWVLVPGSRLRELGDEADSVWRRASKNAQRCGELEAEIERLREASEKIDGIAAAAREALEMTPVPGESEGEGSDPLPIDTWVLASIDDLRSRVDALESEVRDAHVNASGMSGYFTLGGRLNSMQKRICALESSASVPVPEGDEGPTRQELLDELNEVGADLSRHEDELREIVDAINDALGYEYPLAGSHPINLDGALAGVRELAERRSPVLDEPEGEKALRFLRELRQYLDRRLRKYGDGDLSDYEVGCKQELEGVSTWLAEFEAQPAPPSLNPEGLAELDAAIERLQREARDGQLGLLRDLAQKKADAYRQAREWLVSTPSEGSEGGEG